MRFVVTFTFLAGAICGTFAQTLTPLTIIADASPICADRSVNFRVANDSTLSAFSWTVQPARSLEATSSNGRQFSVTFHTPGAYTISVAATDTATRTGSTAIVVSRTARAAFNASLASQGYPNDLVLTNYSSNNLSSVWRFSDGSNDSSLNVTKSYAASGAHSVDLIAFGQNGCNDTASYSFYLADSSGITLPNIFTPNGDGVNDAYRPIARGIRSLQARIFNREQLMLHSWDRVNGFWDGRTTGGEPCTDGVYVIVVEATGFDGRQYSLRGTITLIR